MFEQGDFAMVEYLIPDGTCGYLHVSKPGFTAADEAVFARFLEGARIIARP